MPKVDNKLSWQSIKQPVTPGGSWGGGMAGWADGPESRDGTPKNQQYPVRWARERNLSLKRPKETGIYKTPG